MKRFYKSAAVCNANGGWQVELDGRAVKTANGAAQIVVARALAEAMAAEWNIQGDEIDPRGLTLRDASDYAIDIVAADRETAIAKLLEYAETDTLCYRADPDDALYRRQTERWDPVLAAFEESYGLRMERTSGLMHRPQPEAAIANLKRHLSGLDDFALAALTTAASLAASLCIGLAALDDGADAEALWALANLEEDWQVEQWGKDEQAAKLRAERLSNFTAAVRFAALAKARV
ncbi:ATP12 family protein [Altererythrobacter aquiaggeris]|uniref:ATP12 family protein n=1 Tax=Aestuarierythrobacter aquiaggeris TaxID=1898396 RepID=UPI0030163E5C